MFTLVALAVFLCVMADETLEAVRLLLQLVVVLGPIDGVVGPAMTCRTSRDHPSRVVWTPIGETTSVMRLEVWAPRLRSERCIGTAPFASSVSTALDVDFD